MKDIKDKIKNCEELIREIKQDLIKVENKNFKYSIGDFIWTKHTESGFEKTNLITNIDDEYIYFGLGKTKINNIAGGEIRESRLATKQEIIHHCQDIARWCKT